MVKVWGHPIKKNQNISEFASPPRSTHTLYPNLDRFEYFHVQKKMGEKFVIIYLLFSLVNELDSTSTQGEQLKLGKILSLSIRNTYLEIQVRESSSERLIYIKNLEVSRD